MTDTKMSADEVLEYIDDAVRYIDASEDGPSYGAERLQSARTAVAAMIAERDGYKAAWWDVVEMLGGKMLPDISNAQYHASVLAPKLRELIAERDALLDAGTGMLSDYQDLHGERACDCRPEPENGGHVCNACLMRHALGPIDAARAEASNG